MNVALLLSKTTYFSDMVIYLDPICKWRLSTVDGSYLLLPPFISQEPSPKNKSINGLIVLVK